MKTSMYTVPGGTDGGGPVVIRFHHYSDLDGDVAVVLPEAMLGQRWPARGDDPATVEVVIPGAALKELVLDWLRDRAVRRLEEADYDTLADHLTH